VASANAETGPEQYSPDAPKIKHPTRAEREAARIKFDGAIGNLDGVTDTERFAYKEIFDAEGDILTDEKTGASSGITRKTLREAQKKVPELAGLKDPTDLTINQRAAFYRWYFDDALKGVGGHAALDEVGGKDTAAAVADTLFRHGQDVGSRAVQEAVNDVIDKLPEERRRELGLDHVDVDGVIGSRTFSAIQTIVGNGSDAGFRHALSLRRLEPAVQDKVNEAEQEKGRTLTPEEIRHGNFSPDRGDIERFRHFRFEGSP
jgi:hypothetical protein